MWCRKQKYKHELDLMLKVKNQQRALSRSMLSHEVADENMRVSQALVEEKTDAEARKAYELNSLRVTIANQEARQGHLKYTMEAEKRMDEERLRQARMSLEREREIHAQQKLQEAATCQMVKENQSRILAERQATQKAEDQRYAQTELERLDTMLLKNREFMDGIRHRLDKYEECQKVTEAVHNEFVRGRRRTDYVLAQKPYEDRLKAELEQERQQLQDIRQRRTDLSRKLLRQIEEGALEKNQRLFNELQEEHRLLCQELERFDVKEKQRKTVQCQQLRQMLETLQQQIRYRRESLREQDRMSGPEVGLNNPRDPADSNLFVPGRTIQFVPGYANQYDKLLMNAYQDKVVELDSRNLEQTLTKNELTKENQLRNQSGTYGTRRRTVDQLTGVQKAQHMSEYDFIRNRHKNGVFNIITNDRL